MHWEIKSYNMSKISGSKGNQIMNFGLLIERNMINIYLEKSYAKCGGKTSSTLFSKKSKLIICLDQQSDVLYSMLLLYVKVEE